MLDEPLRRELLTQLAGFRRKYGANPFTVLDIDPIVQPPNSEEIHDAYIAAMKSAHPDVLKSNSPIRFDAAAINEAFYLLRQAGGLETALEFVLPDDINDLQNFVFDSDLTGFRSQIRETIQPPIYRGINSQPVKGDHINRGQNFPTSGENRNDQKRSRTDRRFVKLNKLGDRILKESEQIELLLIDLKLLGIEEITFEHLAQLLGIDLSKLDANAKSSGNRAFRHMFLKAEQMDDKINIEKLSSGLCEVTQTRINRISMINNAHQILRNQSRTRTL